MVIGMNNEIKEILEQLKIRNDLYNGRDESCIVPIEYYEAHVLLDCITHLQQKCDNLEKAKKDIYNDWLKYNNRCTKLEYENEKLKENAIHNDKVVDKAKWNEMLYKSRIDKAIEYIELWHYRNDFRVNSFTKGVKKELLNILNGGDDNG